MRDPVAPHHPPPAEKAECAAVSAITPSISTTDCAEEEPRSPLSCPSRYTFTTSVSVALPGPPWVSAWMVPNVSNAA